MNGTIKQTSGVIAVRDAFTTYSIGDEITLHPNTTFRYAVVSIEIKSSSIRVLLKRTSRDEDIDEKVTPLYASLTLLNATHVIESY